MRVGAAIVAAVFLLALPGAAPAQDPHPAPPSPLKPGRSAGIHAAQQEHVGLALVGAGAVIAVVVVVATASSSSGGNPVNPQSNSTATTS